MLKVFLKRFKNVIVLIRFIPCFIIIMQPSKVELKIIPRPYMQVPKDPKSSLVLRLKMGVLTLWYALGAS